MPDAITLTRAEAVGVGYALHATLPFFLAEIDGHELDGREEDVFVAAVETLKVLADRADRIKIVRVAGGWWGKAHPEYLDMMARYDGLPCPDEFTLAAEAVPALCELLPWILSEIEEGNEPDHHLDDEDHVAYLRRRDAVLGLADRLGVPIATEVG